MKPLVSVLVLNYNHKDFLRDMFESIRKLSRKCRYEVFLIDNNSSDGSVEYAKTHFSEVRIVQTGANLGTPGFNKAIPYLKGDFVAWFGVDSKLHPDSLANMVSTFNSNPKVGAIYPFEVDFSGKYADNGMVLSRVLYFFSTSRLRRKQQMIGVGPGMIRMPLLRKIGYIYDPLYFYGYEDIDLAFHVRLLGYQVIQDNSAIMYHRGSISMKRYLSPSFKVYLGERNAFITYFKIFQWRTILVFLPYYVVFRLALMLKDLAKFNFSSAAARLRGMLWVPLHFPAVMKKRKTSQSLRTVSDNKMLAPVTDEMQFLKALFDKLLRRESFNIYELGEKTKRKL